MPHNCRSLSISFNAHTGGIDYSARTGTLSFTSTTNQPLCVNIPIIDDEIEEEPVETFNLAVTQVLSAGVATLSPTVTIFDNGKHI